MATTVTFTQRADENLYNATHRNVYLSPRLDSTRLKTS
jgi:hypothetical protein